jgi:hypothetical protein
MRSFVTAVDYALPEHRLCIGPVLRPLVGATPRERDRDLVLQAYAEHQAEASEVSR